MIKVINEVSIHEIDGKETSVPTPVLTVLSHWNHDSLVVLHTDGKKITVSARELQAAITNATNVVRFG